MGRSLVGTYARLAELPVEIEGYELAGLEQTSESGFTRATTVVRLRGAGQEGVGEDVVWSSADQTAFQEAGPVLPLAGSWTLDSLSARLQELERFPADQQLAVYSNYRRWAFESAALDLALRQAGRSLAEVLARESRPVRFVVSMALGEAPTAEPVRRWLELYPGLRFKLDSSSAWTPELIRELAATGAVATIDLKGAYGEAYGEPANPVLYARVAEGFPGAWIEDPDLSSPEARAVLEAHLDRVSWDAPIHSVDDITGLPFAPKVLNIKPSRFGSVRALLDAYDYCAAHEIVMYGGGQFELGPGRGQIQYLASLFHPEAPNDVAPGEYNRGGARPGLPRSPLSAKPAATGFGWEPRTG